MPFIESEHLCSEHLAAKAQTNLESTSLQTPASLEFCVEMFYSCLRSSSRHEQLAYASALPHLTSAFDASHGHRILLVKEGDKRQILDEAMRAHEARYINGQKVLVDDGEFMW